MLAIDDGQPDRHANEDRDQFDRFSSLAQLALVAAEDEARTFNHNFIGTEHIVRGLLSAERGQAATALCELGVHSDRFRSAFTQIVGRGEETPAPALGMTPRAKSVINLGVEEAQRPGHDRTTTGHLLLGILIEGQNVAVAVLESMNVTAPAVRTKLAEIAERSDKGIE